MSGFHGCRFSFEELTNHALPELLEVLVVRMVQAETLANHEFGKLSGLPSRRACYVFLEGDCPLYVGISRNLRARIKQHLSRRRSEANLCVRFAASALSLSVSQAVHAVDFEGQFDRAHDRLLACRIAWVEVDDAMTLYLLEPFVAMKLNTQEFNRFDVLQILTPRK
jgi:predicted GIY-YIG superfamily endonuclease